MADDVVILALVERVDVPRGSLRLPSVLIFESSRDLSKDDSGAIQQTLRPLIHNLTSCNELGGEEPAFIIATSREYPRRMVVGISYPWEGEASIDVLNRKIEPYLLGAVMAA